MVAPILPDPVLVMSLFVKNLVISFPKGIDPIKYDLLFERFLNPDRISNPDFDIDFCRDGREKVIEYVTEKYGKEAVAQICTFGTMAARAVVRDVARAQGKSYSLGDKIAKLIPFSPEMTLERAIKESKDLKQILKIGARGPEDLSARPPGLRTDGGRVFAPLTVRRREK